MTREPAEILRFGDYEAGAFPAESNRLIVACSGIRGFNLGRGRFEWGRTLRALPEDANLLFVGNPARTWYATPQGRDDLIGHIERFRDARGVAEVTVMGLSMGATGALILGGRLAADRVLAINPRLRIGRAAAPWDGRNRDHVDAMGQPEIVEVVEHLSATTRHRIVCSLDSLEDLAHLSALFDRLDAHPGERGRFDILGYRGDHHLGLALHDREALTPVMRRLLADETGELPAIFAPVDAALCRLAREHLTHGDAGLTRAALAPREQKRATPTPLPFMRLLETDGVPFVHANQKLADEHLARLAARGWRATPEGLALNGAEGELLFRPFDFDAFDAVECTLAFAEPAEGLDVAVGGDPITPILSDGEGWTASFAWPGSAAGLTVARPSRPLLLTEVRFAGRRAA